MTRDTARVHDDRSPNDIATFAALWAAAPFPHLPGDAPPELKKLMIEVEDPRRVYTIHKATRRHHFQQLLDRFGCTYKACTVTTCFSCRKRLANGAPVRRYNATSARTLAFYLMGLDNPEQSLCPHTPAIRPNVTNKSSMTKNVPLLDDTELSSNNDAQAKSTRTAPNSKIPYMPRQELSTDNIWKKEIAAELAILDEPTTIDHRSFVQNIFETVAIKMTEWLTPRYLESLAGLQGGLKLNPNTISSLTGGNISESEKSGVDIIDSRNPRGECDVLKEDQGTNQSQNHQAVIGSKLPTTNPISCEKTSPRRLSLTSQKQTNTSDSPILKEKLKKLSAIESINDRSVSANQRSAHSLKRKPLKQALILSPQIPVNERESKVDVPLPLSPNPQAARNEAPTNPPKLAEKIVSGVCQKKLMASPSREITPELPHMNPNLLPQSLSTLTIETIEFMCNILQTDGTCEKHCLHPQNISEELKKKLVISRPRIVLQRNHLLQSNTSYPSPGKQKWKAFIEQSFFDVLGTPTSLLRTFSNEDKKLFDSPTIWYLMLHMTRSTPALVLDSLWNAVGTLFRPPKQLEITCHWEKDISSHRPSYRKAVSSYDAARVVNICLHALVAAIPLVNDARQLAHISRIRSYGMSMLARESSLESVTLCLQYEDTFTNELAVRLARRVFAAIPTRRRFSELLELQDVQNGEKREPDILDTVLSTFELFNPSSQPILVFSEADRILHRKRMPNIILDWARTVMLHDWNGRAVVPSDGPIGGALATIAAIHKNRKSFSLSGVHFRTEYFAERLDSIETPLGWHSFNPNQKTIHLLDHPYLFNPATLVTYFRAINFSKMDLAYKTAKSEFGRMSATMHEHSLMVDKYSRDKLQERLRTATTKFMVMEIRRTHVLMDTFNSIWRREERELMRPLKLRLGEEGGEEGSDSGGVQQEYLRLAIAEALDPDYGTFTVDARTRMTWFQPGSPEPLWKYELIGTIISLAVYNGLTLPVTFPNALYVKLLNEEVTELHHIVDGWPDLVNGLTSLLEWDEKDGLVEDVFARTYEFSVEQFGQPVTREMKDTDNDPPTWPQFPVSSKNATFSATDAPLVTKENRAKYVNDYIRYLTDISIRPQFRAFKNGFFTCISRRSVSLFDAATLQSLIEGVQEIDISELRQVTRYIGWDGNANHHTIRDFWSVVMKYDLDMKRKLLEFVTASDRVPVGGMCGLQFTIQKNGVEDRLLPTSYTCYGILLLPEYSNIEVLEGKLAMALENSKGFGFA